VTLLEAAAISGTLWGCVVCVLTALAKTKEQ
jgi:hypothetical protein